MTATMHVFTGPPGAGKTSVLDALRPSFDICEEPARIVLAEQRATGGRGTGDQDAGLFVSLMLRRAVEDYQSRAASATPILFDRGLPDLLGFARHYSVENNAIQRECERFRYNTRVFWFPHWPDIYMQDDERRATPGEAEAFGALVEDGYRALGYTLVEVPKLPVDQRAAFIRAELSA